MRRRARVGASGWTKSSSQSGSLPTFLGETLREGPERLKGKTGRWRQRWRSFYLCQQPGAAQKTNTEKSDGHKLCLRTRAGFSVLGLRPCGCKQQRCSTARGCRTCCNTVAVCSPGRGKEWHSQPFRCAGIPAGAQLSQNTARVEEGLFPFKPSSH